ncbi:radical SAM/SPASM domain-containing protein [Alkaliphilus transvaalensis]|uniref:radical SAM/SPASM domain-containing protein n=1 Tax=Alkaliphilus transvaalensis TaxID=114628 RepID=UPI000685B7E9|nr:radical SAM protein [Alkaliphilus transvaalensis]
MKESNYNFFITKEDETGIIAYNSYTSAMAEMSMEEFNNFKMAREIGFESLDQEMFEALKKNGYIVEENFNEIDAIECSMLKAKYSTDQLVLTIAPTEDCNFRCIYCYEKDSIKPKYMDLKTADNIILFIKNKIKSIKGLSITWYGGEPLLGVDIIKYISDSVIEICNENQVQYYSFMITNGYLLNKANLDILSQCHIKSFQITIDGDRETHDKRRFLTGGTPSFDKIMDNLKLINDYEMTISLRINVDKSNINAVEKVTNSISEINEKKKINCYLGKVMATGGCYKDKECFNNEEFSNLNLNFSIRNYKNIIHMYPKIKSIACGAEGIFSLVIGADGEAYKCWEDIGKQELSVGNINDKLNFYNKTNMDYLLNNPIKEEKCKECKYLPLCMGGCLKRTKGKDSCDIPKYILESILTEVYANNR